MTALTAVASYLPAGRVPIEELAGRLGLSDRQVRVFRRFHGLSEVCRDHDGTLFDLLAAAVGELDELRGREHLVKYVLYARGMPVAVPYPANPLHELCRKLGLAHAVAFTVTHHACATGLLAVDIAGRLLASDGVPGALALVIAGEKTFTRDAELVPDTSIFGEGAAACLVSADGASDRLLSYVTRLRGDFDGRLVEDPGLAVRFAKEYPGSLAEVILAAVQRAGLALDEISLIVPHNVNAVSWRRLCRMIGYPVDRVLLDNVAVTGHCFAADAFLNYRLAADRGLLNPGDRYLMVAAGLGATFSAMVFEH
ncbi:3-oxoacyl-ACP synthase [Solihabitans fulvus]|uniref:3-oxoacyl-ACP synthase n=1 Tax=Solihabitans fulvus TaxID=1892852 RepID=A0A5B2WXW3_9PSEU|nr:3-oxoacyl-[acyl-carrier-protein] synthase III C-terminal domain-containing protein [Solihabitans fulvus]KAA2255918.1 3-oxoacyl-ACP synthase [Solihabitans fulvus]